MTLRVRLAIGIVSITIILLIPLLLALRSLESVHQTTRSLRDRELAGSLQLGRFRKFADDIKRGEDALAVLHTPAELARMRTALAALSATGDSLDRYKLSPPGEMSTAILSLRSAIDAEYAAASTGNGNVADEIAVQRTRPALSTLDKLIAQTEALQEAQDWLRLLPNIEGVVAKRWDGRYLPGQRDWVKVKRRRTIDCVVIGIAAVTDDTPLVGSATAA